ncbi:MAG: CbbQ/NirQ/NorQ/GpvN family protein [Dehalococcoidia bacterium]|jgi:nitric oxide reductase NorQ protein|nr:AAA family ATPase [Chloroflexota bacterium]MBP06230.1 AAA family ATPase [Chloroflexota bacterium]|tara:strand:- start:8560 stop:9408 length:849 start_codon:yes stop_codon:yes gene_type:complete
MATQSYKEVNAEEYIVENEPFFMPTSDEIEVFQAAYNERVPILLKGPTGTGKTRFVEYMSWKLNDNKKKTKDIPLVTVACHEDLTASDLVGRYLLDASGTKWIDGPLTRAVKSGGICYLDEVVEARKDTTVIIHPLTDHRRTLSIDKLGQVIQADDGFLLVVSYNPGYQNAVKDLKHSTRQRFVAIEFDFPDVERETKIISHESGVEEGISNQLAVLGQKIRNLREHGLEEGASTRLLIYAARLIKQGISPKRACQVALTWGITDEVQIQETVDQIVSSIFE